MSQRQEVRFKVFNTTNSNIAFTAILPYNVIAFNEGGSYNTTNYEYTIPVSGIYLIGFSYIKSDTNRLGTVQLILKREGNTRTITLTQSAEATIKNRTLNDTLMYSFLLGDIIYLYTPYGLPKMNASAYTTNDIYNSFWGIRLDY
jgi:hypothetical protein